MNWNIDRKKCMTCGACVGVCSTNAIELKVIGISYNEKKCVTCKSCEVVCPVNAIRVE